MNLNSSTTKVIIATLMIVVGFFGCQALAMGMVSYGPAQIAKASSTSFMLAVPFTSQAPLAEWSDERQQDGCEEAAVIMAMSWIKNEKTLGKTEAKRRIVTLSDFELKKYGEFRDVALADIVKWDFNDYYNYKKVSLKKVVTANDILNELEQGNIVLAPMNGQALKNPYFTAPGPERHMVLIKGYDYKTQQFITNDSGTRRGESYRYSAATMLKAIRPYKTGNKLPFAKTLVKEMIVVSK